MAELEEIFAEADADDDRDGSSCAPMDVQSGDLVSESVDKTKKDLTILSETVEKSKQDLFSLSSSFESNKKEIADMRKDLKFALDEIATMKARICDLIMVVKATHNGSSCH